MPPAQMNKIERAHQMYRDGRHEEALGFYTEALALAKTRAQKIALHSNRAACYLKLHDFDKAAKECTSVLELDHKHTGALMLRAQTLVTLKEYHSALFDVNRLIELNPSSEVYQNLHARLKTQLSLATIPEAEAELEEEDEEEYETNPEHEEEQMLEEDEGQKDYVLEANQYAELEERPTAKTEGTASQSLDLCEKDEKGISSPSETKSLEELSEQNSSGLQPILKPKGHTALDYSRWDRVEDDSSEEEDDDDEQPQPQYRFRVRTVGVRAVK
ncbi:hypothetical protein LguiA_023523 [Lonicera macranthoides]